MLMREHAAPLSEQLSRAEVWPQSHCESLSESCARGWSSDAGGAHAGELIAARSACENHQAAEGSRLFPDTHTHNQTAAQSSPAYRVWNVVVVVAIIKIIIIFTSFSSPRNKEMSLWSCCKDDILFCKLFLWFGQGRMLIFSIRIIFFY